MDTTAQVLEKPYQTNSFLPGNMDCRPAQYFTDAGYTINLLSKTVFDNFHMYTRRLLEESCVDFRDLSYKQMAGT